MKKVGIVLVLLMLILPNMSYASFYSELREKFGITQPVQDIFSTKIQQQYDWDSSGNILYEGIAASGVSSTDGNWLIKKYEYNDSDYTSSPSGYKTAFGAWDSRTSLTYE